MTEELFVLQGYEVKVTLEEHSVHIVNDHSLQQFIEQDPHTSAAVLVQYILEAFERHFSRPLAIASASMVVEIWGHVYAGHLGQVLENLVQLKLVERVAGIIVEACATIDCGEPGHDHNRWFWDMLAPFKDRIAGWLTVAGNDKEEHDLQ